MVAAHVVMLMLALARGLDESREGLRQASALQPSGWAYNWPACRGVNGLAGRTIGLIGLGQVGALVARYLRPFGVTVLYTRRNRDRAAEAELGIVNTARGSIIDEDALVAALKSGAVGAAALDVFTSEPLQNDHPLHHLKNVILTPHVAAGTRDEAWLDREIGPIVDAVVSTLRNE